MKTRLILIFGIALFVVGCVSTEKYNSMLQSWVGQTEDQLVSSWGAPTSSYVTDTAKYLTYDRIHSGYSPPIPPSYQTIRSGDSVFVRPVGGSPGYAYTNECRTTFMVQKGIVKTATASGNSCAL